MQAEGGESEVLEETQMEMVALRQELERTKLALHTEREKHSQLAAQYTVMTTELQTMKAAKQAEEAAKAAAIAAKKEAARLEEERRAMLMLPRPRVGRLSAITAGVAGKGASAAPSPGSPGVKLLVPPPSREIGNAPGPFVADVLARAGCEREAELISLGCDNSVTAKLRGLNLPRSAFGSPRPHVDRAAIRARGALPS